MTLQASVRVQVRRRRPQEITSLGSVSSIKGPGGGRGTNRADLGGPGRPAADGPVTRTTRARDWPFPPTRAPASRLSDKAHSGRHISKGSASRLQGQIGQGPLACDNQTPKSPMPRHRGRFPRSRRNRESRFPRSRPNRDSRFPDSRPNRESGQSPEYFPDDGPDPPIIPAQSGSGKSRLFSRPIGAGP